MLLVVNFEPGLFTDGHLFIVVSFVLKFHVSLFISSPFDFLLTGNYTWLDRDSAETV